VCIVRSIGSREVVKRREVKIDEGLELEDILREGNLSSRPVLTSRKAERLRRSDQARFPQEGQDRMSPVYRLGRS
jgi:sulfur carrier protein ThiS